jgi:methionyl-tRNA formyltransferase
VAVGPLRALSADGHDIRLVVSAPDRRRGRGGALVQSPVKRAALDLGLQVSDAAAAVIDSGAELGVVVAFGRLIRPPVLARVPMVNLHFSLLPRWRGAAPVERAILAGDLETGVCLMQIDEGLDTGPVYARVVTSIDDDETAHDLSMRLGVLGTQMLRERLHDWPDSLGEPVPQEGEPSYAAKIDPSELHIDWSRPAFEIERVIRLGRAWTTWRGARLIAHRGRVVPPPFVGCPAGSLHGAVVCAGGGAIELLELQPESKAVQDFASWARGARPLPGELLGP